MGDMVRVHSAKRAPEQMLIPVVTIKSVSRLPQLEQAIEHAPSAIPQQYAYSTTKTSILHFDVARNVTSSTMYRKNELLSR